MKDLEILKRMILEADEEAVENTEDSEKVKEKPKNTAFEKDPMGFILKKYNTLNEIMTELMTKNFREFVDAIFYIAPKPTTFKIMLHNGQTFFMTYMKDNIYEAIIGGKRYYLAGIGEKERCMMAIARLLRFGTPLKTKGAEGAEEGTRDNTGMEGDWAEQGGATGGAATSGGEEEVTASAEETGREELAENKIILERILIKEAYTFFPKSEKEINNKYVKQLFKTTKEYSDIEDPIAMDPTKDKNITVKITRKLQQDPKFIKHLEKSLGSDLNKSVSGFYKLGNVKVDFGEGSRGGRGVKSKGLGFEGSLAGDLEKLSKEGLTKQNADSFMHPKLIAEISSQLGLKKGNFTISLDGSANKPRPLAFTSKGPEVSFSGESVADTLTDITINKDGKPYYISAKFGGTLTFFNSGVAKTLPADEIKKGEIKNPNGVALLKALGIDNKSFCAVFNYYAKGKPGKFTPKQISADIPKLQNLVSSGIGSGYYYAQAGKGEDQFFKIDDKYNKNASAITTTPQVYYGGIDGKGKRIDIVFESDKYIFKVNIRNKQGGIYPSHIMCDYKAK